MELLILGIYISGVVVALYLQLSINNSHRNYWYENYGLDYYAANGKAKEMDRRALWGSILSWLSVIINLAVFSFDGRCSFFQPFYKYSKK